MHMKPSQAALSHEPASLPWQALQPGWYCGIITQMSDNIPTLKKCFPTLTRYHSHYAIISSSGT